MHQNVISIVIIPYIQRLSKKLKTTRLPLSKTKSENNHDNLKNRVYSIRCARKARIFEILKNIKTT